MRKVATKEQKAVWNRSYAQHHRKQLNAYIAAWKRRKRKSSPAFRDRESQENRRYRESHMIKNSVRHKEVREAMARELFVIDCAKEKPGSGPDRIRRAEAEILWTILAKSEKARFTKDNYYDRTSYPHTRRTPRPAAGI